jgi:hypothetical protein
MKKAAFGLAVFSLALAGCSGDDNSHGAAGSSGAGGDTTSSTSSVSVVTGSGSTVTAGTGGGSDTTGASGSATGSSGTGGSGGDSSGAGTSGASGVTGAGGTGGTGGASGSGGSAGSGGGDVPDSGGVAASGWYEAEAKPPNILYGRAVVSHCKNTCPSMSTIKPGDECCSGGGEVNWIVSGSKGPDPQPPDGRGGGELRWMNISAPADGMYDVTWWYHCGNNDNFGDKNCGGQTDPPTMPSGCRPHQIIVNGTEMPGTYHFPCFGGSWGIIRAATTTLPLKAGGDNWVHVYATKPRDAADMDALQISPVGKGTPPLIKSNNDPIGH